MIYDSHTVQATLSLHVVDGSSDDNASNTASRIRSNTLLLVSSVSVMLNMRSRSENGKSFDAASKCMLYIPPIQTHTHHNMTSSTTIDTCAHQWHTGVMKSCMY